MPSNMSLVKFPFNLIDDDPRPSDLRVLLEMLPIKRGGTTVDVGAGGFAGIITTDPALETLGGRVICIEQDEHLCAGLRAKYDINVSVIQGYYGEVGAGQPADLVIIDTDTGTTPLIYGKMIYFAIADGLKLSGFIIASVVYDVSCAYPQSEGSYDPGEYLNPAGRNDQAGFMNRFFGAETLTTEIIARTFEKNANFEFIGLASRYLTERRNGLGWLVLRRFA
jgi:hypothetical protein